MIIQSIKDAFNLYKPISVKEYWKSMNWLILWGILLIIPGTILEKNGADLEVLVVIGAMFLVGIQCLLFIFTLKRFRAMHIPPIWAVFMFIPPFYGICFIISGLSEDSAILSFLKRLFHYLKEEPHG